MRKAVYFVTKIIKEAVYPCRRKAICTVYEFGKDKPLCDFASDPFWAEKQALQYIEENGWHNVSYNAETGTITGLAEVKIEELAGSTIPYLKKLFTKKIGGTVHKKLTTLKYTMESCDKYRQTVTFTVTATLTQGKHR